MRRNQKGQVLPLGLVLVVFTMAGALMLFNTSQVATDKMRLANSADAAAYSGALWQARALNYQAYANRAMVANQVAIGQAVSLQSWMTYAKVTSEHIATALTPVPLLNLVTSGIEGGVRLAEKGVSLGAQTLLMSSNVANVALSVSQSAMHAATLLNTAEIISVVASETDSRFTTNSAYGIGAKGANAGQWLAFNTRYSNKDKDAMKQRQGLIMASRDKFTRSRNWNLFDFWVFSTPLSWHKLRRQGETQLVSVNKGGKQEWEWIAKDTMSIHNKTIGFFKSRETELPVSWASSFANSRNTNQPIKRQACGMASVLGIGFGTRKCTKMTRHNRIAEEFADSNVRSFKSGSRTLKPLKGYKGLQDFWVLSDDAKSADDAQLTVRVEVSLPARELRDTADIMHSGQMSSPVVTAGKSLSSISVAKVSYRRPNHHSIAPNKREKANAYNPYWQAQLAPVSAAHRLMATGIRSGGAAPNARPAASGQAVTLGRYVVR